MAIFIFLLLVCAITIVVIMVNSNMSDLSCFLLVFCSIIAFVSVSQLIDFKNPSPEAIDVYRNKTTLVITYRDSIAIDSTVVFKPEYDGR